MCIKFFNQSPFVQRCVRMRCAHVPRVSIGRRRRARRRIDRGREVAILRKRVAHPWPRHEPMPPLLRCPPHLSSPDLSTTPSPARAPGKTCDILGTPRCWAPRAAASFVCASWFVGRLPWGRRGTQRERMKRGKRQAALGALQRGESRKLDRIEFG